MVQYTHQSKRRKQVYTDEREIEVYDEDDDIPGHPDWPNDYNWKLELTSRIHIGESLSREKHLNATWINKREYLKDEDFVYLINAEEIHAGHKFAAVGK